ncbi:hypothetical protein EX30DRAFT_364649 [Ascodesmis nigricans]|uniref:Uncharacterized protein n=1 Tax=Ascodesmis nigricans TaxID=341454 RepID=A0A4S2MV54_9PEZI|nr:hypothetical protein EX30DRAFT_364649 [Ascodesmis nigricans]
MGGGSVEYTCLEDTVFLVTVNFNSDTAQYYFKLPPHSHILHPNTNVNMLIHLRPADSIKYATEVFEDIVTFNCLVKGHLSRTTVSVFSSSRMFIPDSEMGAFVLGGFDPRTYCDPSHTEPIRDQSPTCIGCCTGLPPVDIPEPISISKAMDFLARSQFWFNEFLNYHWDVKLLRLYELDAHFRGGWKCSDFPPPKWNSWMETYNGWRDESRSQAMSWMQHAEEGRELVRLGEEWLQWKETHPLMFKAGMSKDYDTAQGYRYCLPRSGYREV